MSEVHPFAIVVGEVAAGAVGGDASGEASGPRLMLLSGWTLAGACACGGWIHSFSIGAEACPECVRLRWGCRFRYLEVASTLPRRDRRWYT